MNLTKQQTEAAIKSMRSTWWTLSIDEKRGLVPVYKKLILLRESQRERIGIEPLKRLAEKSIGLKKGITDKKTRKQEVVWCRSAIWYEIYKQNENINLQNLADIFKKDRGTVYHALIDVKSVMQNKYVNINLYNVLSAVRDAVAGRLI